MKNLIKKKNCIIVHFSTYNSYNFIIYYMFQGNFIFILLNRVYIFIIDIWYIYVLVIILKICKKMYKIISMISDEIYDIVLDYV